MPAPTITSLTPGSGPAAGGTAVAIVGTNMTTVTAVTFGAVAATAFVADSATLLYATAPAGTGTVTVTVTNPDGAATSTYSYESALFTVDEARAFDRAQLSNDATFPDAAIIAKESEIRQWLTRVCGVDFIPTAHTDELHSGDHPLFMRLDWPLVTSVDAVSNRVDATWTAFTSGELATVIIEPGGTGFIYRESGTWASGRSNYRISYTAGYPTAPALVKRAALRICALEMPTSDIPFSAERYDSGGMDVSFANGDGFNDHWHRDADVMKAIRMYTHRLPGIA
jgi:hypothetical protein